MEYRLDSQFLQRIKWFYAVYSNELILENHEGSKKKSYQFYWEKGNCFWIFGFWLINTKQKWSFLLKIFSVNMTKFAGIYVSNLLNESIMENSIFMFSEITIIDLSSKSLKSIRFRKIHLAENYRSPNKLDLLFHR